MRKTKSNPRRRAESATKHLRAPNGFRIRRYTGGLLDSGKRGAKFEVEELHGATVGAKTKAQALRLAWEVIEESE